MTIQRNASPSFSSVCASPERCKLAFCRLALLLPARFGCRIPLHVGQLFALGLGLRRICGERRRWIGSCNGSCTCSEHFKMCRGARCRDLFYSCCLRSSRAGVRTLWLRATNWGGPNTATIASGSFTRYPAAVFASHRSSASGDGELYETPDGKACSSAPLQIRTTSPRAHIRPLSQGSLILV